MRPFKLPVGLATYTVKFKKKVVADGDTCNGICDYEDKIIEIQSTGTLEVQVTTLWHEFTHALLHELGATALTTDEAFVESVAQNIARAIRALPEGFK